MQSSSIKLVVDEGTQGSTKTFESIESLVAELTPLLDENLIEVNVKRNRITNNNSVPCLAN